MPADSRQDRIELRFRSPAAPTAWAALPGGWLLWCAAGLAIGTACWLVGRHQLTKSLSAQLANADSSAEAVMAVEGLLRLDAEASLEIVRGLQNPEQRVARTVFRTLDSQLTRWQDQESDVAMARMRSLAEKLNALPDTTPADGFVLAGSLATRIYTICLELDDPQLQPTMELCQQVFQRVGQAHRANNNLASEKLADSAATAAMEMSVADLGAQVRAATPPPPLVPRRTGPFTLSDQTPDSGGNSSSSSESVGAPMASMRFVNGPTRPRSTNNLGEGTSASMSLSDSEPSSDSYSLSDSATIVDDSTSFADDTYAASEPDSLPIAGRTTVIPANQALPSLRPAENGVIVNTNKAISLTSSSHPKTKNSVSQVELQGMDELPIERLVRLLGSVQPEVAKSAALALRRHGMDDRKLILATHLATGSAATRMQLVQEVASSSDLDPRPWLLWMAEDGEPEVRRLCASLLTSMMDQDVQRELRMLLNRERDVEVQNVMRQALVAGQRQF